MHDGSCGLEILQALTRKATTKSPCVVSCGTLQFWMLSCCSEWPTIPMTLRVSLEISHLLNISIIQFLLGIWAPRSISHRHSWGCYCCQRSMLVLLRPGFAFWIFWILLRHFLELLQGASRWPGIKSRSGKIDFKMICDIGAHVSAKYFPVQRWNLFLFTVFGCTACVALIVHVSVRPLCWTEIEKPIISDYIT